MELERDLSFKATELRLGLPGTEEHAEDHKSKINKRSSAEFHENQGLNCGSAVKSGDPEAANPPKAQLVGWPPVRSYRKNNLQAKKTESESGIYVKVSMDGAPYLRKIDLKIYKGYSELLQALENMFNVTTGKLSEGEIYRGYECATAYEDKDGDWMLVGDVPWDMFISSCKRLRMMKGSEARGLGCVD